MALRLAFDSFLARAALEPAPPHVLLRRIGRRLNVLSLTRGDPHDMDGVTDHVGGSALALRASWHGSRIGSAGPERNVDAGADRGPAESN